MIVREGYATFALLVLAGQIPVSPAAAADLIPFAPHRAVYELSLGGSTAGSGVTGVAGRMVYELSGSQCDGYTQNMRFVTVMTNQEGAETLSDLRNSSWEEADAKKLRFSSTQYQNDKLADTSQGDAARSKGATPVVGVDLVKPAKKRVSLPPDIYFPMQHASTLVQAAKSGLKMFAANLYDGSEQGEKYYLTNTVIGKKFDRSAKTVPASFKGADILASVDSWPMTISYFEAGKDKSDQAPSYELSFRYFENGVTSNLKIDYGEFSIRGELKELTALTPGKCPETKDGH
ncbi:cell envelope integrity EipB family protein [Hyphomicrobium sp.]|uniref:cell envelope integrity EipB family protein n=1 Tax=Hyphomicrobium sp. TaxID=82 RepID=UPI001E09A6C1|nr:cell envelope integrity EipB family protein [Hyphomicrobium sp.]MBY0561230.1 cell envelope integrity EipB family protein [Hyphomicrobium sp.]